MSEVAERLSEILTDVRTSSSQPEDPRSIEEVMAALGLEGGEALLAQGAVGQRCSNSSGGKVGAGGKGNERSHNNRKGPKGSGAQVGNPSEATEREKEPSNGMGPTEAREQILGADPHVSGSPCFTEVSLSLFEYGTVYSYSII